MRGSLLVDIKTEQVPPQNVCRSDWDHLLGYKEASQTEGGVNEDGFLQLGFNFVAVKYQVKVRHRKYDKQLQKQTRLGRADRC